MKLAVHKNHLGVQISYKRHRFSHRFMLSLHSQQSSRNTILFLVKYDSPNLQFVRIQKNKTNFLNHK